MRLDTPGFSLGSKRTHRSVSESVTARLNFRAMSSGFSRRKTHPSGMDLDIFTSGWLRLITRAPALGI